MEEKKDIMITQAGCDYCEEAEELLAQDIADRKIEIVPIESSWGARLAEKYNVELTPTIIRRDNDGTKKCFINFEKKVIECEDGTETKISEINEE